jgi:transcription elongation factor Elf1
MANERETSPEIKETDIVFDCPNCGKSLAIDYRGAGLMIPCTDCGKSVQVPIPEGMDISDVDSTEEEQEVRILNLRRSLASAESRIVELETQVEELASRREALEKKRVDDLYRFGQVLEKAGVIQTALATIAEALKTISAIAEEVSRKE